MSHDANKQGAKNQPEKLTWDDLNWLYEKHKIDVSDITEIPGFENF